jgi:hypothetical protein
MTIQNSDFGLLSILGGSGVDNIALDNISVLLGPTNIRTLAGNDILTIQNSSFSSSNVTADMGAGDDTVTLDSNSFQPRAAASGPVRRRQRQ